MVCEQGCEQGCERGEGEVELLGSGVVCWKGEGVRITAWCWGSGNCLGGSWYSEGKGSGAFIQWFDGRDSGELRH